MSVNLIVAVTDWDWFEHLRSIPRLAEANFWSPSPGGFRALQPGELFLFKLHAPIDMIVGGGVFAHASNMPLSLAWDAFGTANGAASVEEMRARVMRYRRGAPPIGPLEIGCRILTQPFFLPELRWIKTPSSFARSIVRFRGYSTDEPDGRALWEAVAGDLGPPDPPLGIQERAQAALGPADVADGPRYGSPVLIKPRLGQGAFQMLVTDNYARRCAVTGERTLPALDAAHIQPYAYGGRHASTNGILLRKDIHSLFDKGYVTITPEHRFEVSRRIKEEFSNGREYYALHGLSVHVPNQQDRQPDAATLRWHNDERFLG